MVQNNEKPRSRFGKSLILVDGYREYNKKSY